MAKAITTSTMETSDCVEETKCVLAGHDEMKYDEEDLSPDISEWSKDEVRKWALKVNETVAEKMFQEDICGQSLMLLDANNLTGIGVALGPAILLIRARDELVRLRKEEPTSSKNQPGTPCKPYPFNRNHDTYRYIEGNILDTIESGPLNLTEPCHEYKAFTKTTDENKMNKFIFEVIRFAAACMNSRTNGTIHFGIGDMPDFTHGQVLGVVVVDKEAYAKELKSAIDRCFQYKDTAQKCIRPPRFVEVLNKNMTSSDKCVIEVDIVPDATICEERNFHTFNNGTAKSKKKIKQLYVRDGGSSSDLYPGTTSGKDVEKNYTKFIDSVAHRSQCRKTEEEKHLSEIKSSTQGSRLSQLITGGTLTLDNSRFEQYVIVTNKSHVRQFESLGFLVELNPTAVLDFDPESAKDGLLCHFKQESTVNVHSPAQYKITEAVEDIANKLKLTRNTSWVFCNGGIEDEAPSNIGQWLMDKGASVRDVISFLCRNDVLPNERFLVIFLLLSTVSDIKDPLVETFTTFYQELRGTKQIICIFDYEKAFTSWKDLIQARCDINITDRCIYELGFAEVNGTVLSLFSKNRMASRFLPCGGGSKVLLKKKEERSLNTLDVLCMNQCEGGNENKIVIEENFYRGGKVSWWNFYLSEEPGSTPFIKRDKFDFIMNSIQNLSSLRKACALFNILHVPGCGGTTLAMHVLWALRDKFRCAVLKDSNADFAEVAHQVVKLLMYDHTEQLPRVPVVLMIDDFDEKEKVFDLQELIEKECIKRDIQSKSAQIILLNCMRSESSELMETAEDTVFIGNNLSEKEQKLFEIKLVEIEEKHKNAETFYGFMIMKTNFKTEYVQGVVRNTLKSFNENQRHAQLLAVLVLLNVYCKGASLSISLCEEFLGLQPKPVCGTVKVEEGFGKFSTLITTCLVESKVVFKAIKMIHYCIAQHCLEELTTTHNVSKAYIADLLLTTKELYQSTQGKDKLLQDVHRILVKRHHLAEEVSQFSPLIQEIAKETPGMEEMVLTNASKRFEKDAVISQLLARYYYLKKKDFSEAKHWAQKAKDLSKDNSYMADTSAQVLKHELKNAIANCKNETIRPQELDKFLQMAQSAIDGFKETQILARKESIYRFNCPFNMSGCLGEIQVGVLVIEILEKSPVFSSDNVHHDIMSQVLSGYINLQDVEKRDQWHNKHKSYYVVLRQFEDVLCNLKGSMKKNFDFLENFYVNLGSKFGMKVSNDQKTQKELLRCFKVYADLFCKTTHGRNKTIPKPDQARQFLEKQKAATYCGILNFLSNDISTEMLEKIAERYDVVCLPHHNPTVTEKINLIYVNVVLSCIKPKSSLVKPYKKLLGLLHQIQCDHVPLSDYLSLLFIEVVLLWPQQHPTNWRGLPKCISQIISSYHEEMKGVCNGKWPIVHFFLGKEPYGYERLVTIGEIKNCITAGPEQFASMWNDGKIWKEKKVKELLCRVTGEVKNRLILADTCVPDQKLEVTPFFRNQVSGHADGSKVSFFIGFSIKGPLALDINC